MISFLKKAVLIGSLFGLLLAGFGLGVAFAEEEAGDVTSDDFYVDDEAPVDEDVLENDEGEEKPLKEPSPRAIPDWDTPSLWDNDKTQDEIEPELEEEPEEEIRNDSFNPDLPQPVSGSNAE